MPTANTSSSPPGDERLVRVPLGQIHPHPQNPNRMDAEQLTTLTRNIERAGRYPPLVVRPHPALPGDYQLLDGEQRLTALQELGHADALCYVWECDDEQAQLLLLTLNRLRGEDVPVQRAELVADLNALMPATELALLLPEDAGELEALLALLDLDADRLLADLTAAAERAGNGLRSITFAVTAADEAVVEAAVTRAMEELDGKNRRGRALTTIAHAYMEGGAR